MWYWTVPSLVLTGAMLFIPGYLNAAGNWVATRHVKIKKLNKFSFLNNF